MIIVTGGAGFIGSRIIKDLNAKGRTDILVVDDLTDGKKALNLSSAQYWDYLDAETFLSQVLSGQDFEAPIDAIFHQGACSDTTQWDGRFMMRQNYAYSKHLLHYCLPRKIPFIYASSAAVYGASTTFEEKIDYESPLNVYGFSKQAFDQYVRRCLPKASSQVVGLRYFNVYGPHEKHKGAMSSVVFHWMNQLSERGYIALFKGAQGYADGEQSRDFIFVDDVVAVNQWFLSHPQASGIFNVGTGQASTFNALAKALLSAVGFGEIKYIDFPEHLKGRYQSYTQADLSALRSVGCDHAFQTIQAGVRAYVNEAMPIALSV